MKRIAVAAAVFALLAVVGLIVSRTGGSASSDGAADSGPAAVAPGPALAPRLVASAEDAAAAAVAMTGEVATAGLISRRELIESFTTPGFGPDLADLTSEQLADMRLSLTEAGRGVTGWAVEEFPLRTRTVELETSRARVEVWSVLVVAARDEPVARQAWRTVTVDLELVEGRWLVDGWSSLDGPTPAGSPEGVLAPGSEVAGRLGWSGVE